MLEIAIYTVPRRSKWGLCLIKQKRTRIFIRFTKTVKHKCGIKKIPVKLKFIFCFSGISHSSFDIRTLHFTQETNSGKYFFLMYILSYNYLPSLISMWTDTINVPILIGTIKLKIRVINNSCHGVYLIYNIFYPLLRFLSLFLRLAGH